MAGESQRGNKIWKGTEVLESGAEMGRKKNRPKEHQESPTLTKDATASSREVTGSGVICLCDDSSSVWDLVCVCVIHEVRR